MRTIAMANMLLPLRTASLQGCERGIWKYSPGTGSGRASIPIDPRRLPRRPRKVVYLVSALELGILIQNKPGNLGFELKAGSACN